MVNFIVKYTHTELKGWEEYLIPHLVYLKDKIKEGKLLMSGPIETNDENVKEVMLIFSVEDRDELQQIIEKDPYWTEGLVSDHVIYEGQPLFGQLGASAEEMEEYFKSQIKE